MHFYGIIKKRKSGDSMTEEIKIIDFLTENQLDAIFVQKDENCRYLSKFTGSDSYLFLTKEGLYLLTDSRYTEQARKEAADYIVVDYESHLAETVAKLVDEYHVKTMGVETVFSYQMYLSFYERMPDMEFKFCQIDQLRQIKSEEEISCIKEACRISDAGFKATLPFIRAGITEARLRTILECAMLEEGSEGKSFDTIVASGERSAYPHGVATGKVLEDGDLVTFDFGAIYKGYHSDITRTVAIGDVSERLQKIYDSVLRCNEHIEMQLKEGIICSEVDKSAREYLKKDGFESYFIHSLGHSVGLEIHESPFLSARDHTVLKENMIETVEPGVYIPGIGGVRIEDTVVIKKDGIEVLTKFPKKFLRM